MADTITMGSLFDGIGGFPLAAVRNGSIVTAKRQRTASSIRWIGVVPGHWSNWNGSGMAAIAGETIIMIIPGTTA